MSAEAAGGIRIRNIAKRYGSTVALDGIDLDIVPGEVLGIAGPNGAGKSTLIRIIAGEERPDSGSLAFDGQPWFPSVDWHQVAVVHQEPQLFPNLTVAENVLVGREGTRTRRPRLGIEDAGVMQALGIGLVKDRLLEDCTLATQQRTEIARAVARDARVFLFDEPNSALTDEESNELFREMHKLAGEGRIVLLVTHRLGDLVEHAARVAVIRDGKVRKVIDKPELTEEAIAEQLVVGTGGEQTATPKPSAETGREIFRVSGWSHGSEFSGVDFSAAHGEIVALMGVEGSGARELLRSFAGLEHCTGSIVIDGIAGPEVFGHTAYVPATRQLSLYSNLSVGENLIARLGVPQIAGPMLRLKKRRMREAAEESVRRFLVKTRTLAQGIRSLSGGNQQKVAIAQALTVGPRLVLLEEPTRGVDIQSKREIYRLLREFAAAGNAVVMFCTEVLEIFEAADRVIVVSDGRLSAPLTVRDFPHIEALAAAITRLERHTRLRLVEDVAA
ncbi:MAG TPA: sugar ABC transporter ATP-binding protein [Bauldia sp.]|nr:sugar ABC transporter ATP-binding protein [Bauldia sp.]